MPRYRLSPNPNLSQGRYYPSLSPLGSPERRSDRTVFPFMEAETARRCANCASSQSLCDFLQFVCRNSKTNWRRTSARGARRSPAGVPDTCRCRTDVQPHQPGRFPSILNGPFHLGASLKRASSGRFVQRLCSSPPLMATVDLVSCLFHLRSKAPVLGMCTCPRLCSRVLVKRHQSVVKCAAGARMCSCSAHFSKH